MDDIEVYAPYGAADTCEIYRLNGAVAAQLGGEVALRDVVEHGCYPDWLEFQLAGCCRAVLLLTGAASASPFRPVTAETATDFSIAGAAEAGGGERLLPVCVFGSRGEMVFRWPGNAPPAWAELRRRDLGPLLRVVIPRVGAAEGA